MKNSAHQDEQKDNTPYISLCVVPTNQSSTNGKGNLRLSITLYLNRENNLRQGKNLKNPKRKHSVEKKQQSPWYNGYVERLFRPFGQSLTIRTSLYLHQIHVLPNVHSEMVNFQISTQKKHLRVNSKSQFIHNIYRRYEISNIFKFL